MQKVRRYGKANGTNVSRKDLTTGQEYKLRHHLITVRCHAEYAIQHGDRRRIPITTLTKWYNERVPAGERREAKALSSHITKHEQLRDLRNWYDLKRTSKFARGGVPM